MAPRLLLAGERCNDRLASVEVTADGREVRVDGEAVGIEAIAEVALSGRYLFG